MESTSLQVTLIVSRSKTSVSLQYPILPLVRISICSHFLGALQGRGPALVLLLGEKNAIYKCRFPEIGVPPVIIHFHGIFHYKPTILGYLHLWKPPNRFHHKPSASQVKKNMTIVWEGPSCKQRFVSSICCTCNKKHWP